MSSEREMTPYAFAALRDLERLSEEITNVQRTLARKRDRRDRLIRVAVEQGASERAAAGSAGVSASYAHAAAKHGQTTRAALSAKRSLAARRFTS